MECARPRGARGGNRGQGTMPLRCADVRAGGAVQRDDSLPLLDVPEAPRHGLRDLRRGADRRLPLDLRRRPAWALSVVAERGSHFLPRVRLSGAHDHARARHRRGARREFRRRIRRQAPEPRLRRLEGALGRHHGRPAEVRRVSARIRRPRRRSSGRDAACGDHRGQLPVRRDRLRDHRRAGAHDELPLQPLPRSAVPRRMPRMSSSSSINSAGCVGRRW